RWRLKTRCGPVRPCGTASPVAAIPQTTTPRPTRSSRSTSRTGSTTRTTLTSCHACPTIPEGSCNSARKRDGLPPEMGWVRRELHTTHRKSGVAMRESPPTHRNPKVRERLAGEEGAGLDGRLAHAVHEGHSHEHPQHVG